MSRRPPPPPVPPQESVETAEDDEDFFDDEAEETYENGLDLVRSDGDEEDYLGMNIETTPDKMSMKGSMAGRAVPPVPPPANQISAPPRPPPSRAGASHPRAAVPEPMNNGSWRHAPPVQPSAEFEEEEVYSECPDVEDNYLEPSAKTAPSPMPTHTWGRPAPPQSHPVGRSDSQRSTHGGPAQPPPRFNGPQTRQPVAEPEDEEEYCAVDQPPLPVPSRKQSSTSALPASRPPPGGVSRGQHNFPPPPQPAPSCEDVYETGEDFAPKPAVRLPPAKSTTGGVTGGKGVQRVAALPPSPIVQQTSADDDIEEQYEELDAMQAMAQRDREAPRQQPESEVEYEEPGNVIHQPAPLPSRPAGRAAPTLPPPAGKGMAPPPTAPHRVNGRVPVPAPQSQPELLVEETYEEPQNFPSAPPPLRGRIPAPPVEESVYETEENDGETYESPEEAQHVIPGFKPNGVPVAPPGANKPAKSVPLMPPGFNSVALRQATEGLKKVGAAKIFGDKNSQLPEVSPQNQQPVVRPPLRKVSSPRSEPEPAPQPSVIQPQLRKVSAPRPEPLAVEQPPVTQFRKFSSPEVTPKPVTVETSPQGSGVDPSTMSFKERQTLMQQSVLGGRSSSAMTNVPNGNKSGTLKSANSFSNGRRPSVDSSDGSGGTFVPSPCLSDTSAPPPVTNRGVAGKAATLSAKAPVPAPAAEVKKDTTSSFFPSHAPVPAPSPSTTSVKRQVSGASNRALPPTPQEQTTTNILQSDDIRVQSWYFGGFNRYEMDALIKEQNKSGMFAVRDNSKGGETPYTLVVYFNNKVWNLMIRRRQDQHYALGTPKADEMKFRGVADMINHYRTHEVTLAGEGGGGTQLLYSPARRA